MPETSSNFRRSETLPGDWKKVQDEKKAQKRKWKEEKLIKQLEATQTKAKEDVQKKARLVDEEREKLETGRQYTVSIALPGSILDNAQTAELRTYLAGQIARAAVVFNVDEIIIFDELGSTANVVEGEFTGIKKGNCNVQLARILQYLECPQYLRKAFFPEHPDLKYAGLLNPLDCPHHVKFEDDSLYREGKVLDKPVKSGKGSFVYVGLKKDVRIDRQLQPGLRVTVKMDQQNTSSKNLRGMVVAPSAPRTDSGMYWGYSVRLAGSLGAVFTQCPYKQGYDITLGTSERGKPVDQFKMPSFNHLLIIFGGVKGLEASLDADQDLKVDDPSLLFHHYINTCPNQGSHTIRTEEAILISLSSLQPEMRRTQSKQT